MSETRVRTLCLIVVSFLIARGEAVCSNIYGGEPCSYVPAPPGKTPPCAQPGYTYCEHPDHYPGQRIHYLLEKWRFDHSTILKDESKEEFSSYFYPTPMMHKHGHYGPNNNIKQDSYYPEPIYIPKPSYTFDEDTRVGNSYIPPKVEGPYNYSDGFAGYPDRRQPFSHHGQFLNYKYSSNIPPSRHLQPSLTLPNHNYGNKVWNRKDETKPGKSILLRKKRAVLIQKNLKKLNGGVTLNHTILNRHKRQSAIAGQTLCQSRSQYIMPRAALNNQGNWMYVVNMPDVDQRLTQLVKSETCASQTCSSLCGLPLGYTSRCEQKYVQKRLVALGGSGNELYNDVFWFPSCCVCTLSNS